MSLFLKLYLAHLIGDFILQFEELYRLKMRGNLGHMYHVLIHTGVSLILVAPYLSDPFLWLFIGFVTIIHYIQDQIKYSLQKKNERLMFPCFIIDQIFHFLVIALILLFPASHTVLPVTDIPIMNIYLFLDVWTLVAIAFIISTFAGGYTLHALRKSYFRGTRPDHMITAFELMHGIIERGTVTLLILGWSHPLAWAASILIGVLRLPSKKLRNKTDFLLSVSLCVCVTVTP